LRQLASEGLVTIRPNRGAVVTQLSPDDVLEIFEMRSVLEGLAARVARPKLDAEAFEDLERLLERMDRYRHSPDQWIRVHNEFHDFICQRSERKRLAEQTLVMRRSVEVYYRVFIGAYHAVEIPGSEHADLLRMIRDGNAETAERAVREHIVSAAREIVGFLKASRPLGAADPAAVPPTARRSQGEGGA
jgi:DNA-binding GntR family transcriptional regulator